MGKKWIIKDVDPALASALAESLELSLVVATILAGRGISSREEGLSFLSPSLSSMPDPLLMKGIQAAVTRLCHARGKGEKICVYGDYDVDGITGAALLVSFLRRTGFDCGYFIPNRFDDGYGLNQDALKRVIDTGVTLILSVDCGITSVVEAEFCRRHGADLIITDHHSPKESLPDACAVVNPLQPGCNYPFKSLAGVGVAFNLIVALRSRLRADGAFAGGREPDLREWLDLVALGTIADVVPLIGQNRIYAYYGLRLLGDSARVGVGALKRVAGVNGSVNCGQVGFRLAPRLNAAGRMECAVPGVELLLGDDPQRAAAIAEELDAANAERQAIERSMLQEAISMVEAAGNYPDCRSIVLASGSWHQGVVGIVASRMVERYHRPTILIALDQDGNGKGSGRSIPGFHLLQALKACADNLERFGGHQFAAGISLKADKLESFSVAFESVSACMLSEDQLVPAMTVDALLAPEDVTVGLIDDLKRLEPFGAGNPEPTFMMRGVKVLDRRVVGDGHLKLRLASGGMTFGAIAFRQAECATDGLIDVAFFPELNVWNNVTSVQLRIKEFRAAEG
ncbi:MAG: single-stranded-DNA-specific exonuclease RecJ [Geobacteraceae bacterium GWC2_55_20]|nr:MAG: single-stranded-DNA-specific exonuclease RecJ [Geobacteraceae bacterium GWC2_55_20]OGU21194.1 MAG: single-stranded-DNA-specific exonuclease RecJ [Geobacteraceae bacterium GWF2_54_21]HBA70897.1 single-stranded-DNA-specific exonuclease RecJ [Geobacter sp.]